MSPVWEVTGRPRRDPGDPELLLFGEVAQGGAGDGSCWRRGKLGRNPAQGRSCPAQARRPLGCPSNGAVAKRPLPSRDRVPGGTGPFGSRPDTSSPRASDASRAIKVHQHSRLVTSRAPDRARDRATRHTPWKPPGLRYRRDRRGRGTPRRGAVARAGERRLDRRAGTCRAARCCPRLGLRER